MKFVIGDDIQAHIELNKQLMSPPKYILSIGKLCAGLYPSSSEMDYVGSKHDPTRIDTVFDTISFDKHSLILNGIGLWANSGNSDEALPKWWQKTPVIVGLPRLASKSAFQIILGEFSWSATDGSLIAVFTDVAFHQNRNTLRMKIAADTYLLLSDTKLVGWMLLNPAKYLAIDCLQVHQPVQDEEIDLLLGKFFELTLGDNLDKLIDGDRRLFDTLTNLKSRLKKRRGDSIRRSPIIKIIDDFLSNYYW